MKTISERLKGSDMVSFYFVIVSFNPRGRNILRSVARLGVVCKDSILATEDCGMLQIAAKSR